MKCNHTSVGMIVERGRKLLLIERKVFPIAWAPPAGHVDEGESYEDAVVRELAEEVGLTATHSELVAEGRKENHCSRPDGAWHYWKIYKVEAEGEVKPSKEETTRVMWYSKDEIKNLPLPRLEPVWSDWLVELGIISE